MIWSALSSGPARSSVGGAQSSFWGVSLDHGGCRGRRFAIRATPGLQRVAAVEPVETLIDPDHRLLEGLVDVLGIREELPAHPPREWPILLMDLDERLRVPLPGSPDQELVIQDGVAAQRAAPARVPARSSYPNNSNVDSDQGVCSIPPSIPRHTTVARGSWRLSGRMA